MTGFILYERNSLVGGVAVAVALCQVPNGDWISDDRTGLTFNDCTSAAFAMDIPWNKVLALEIETTPVRRGLHSDLLKVPPCSNSTCHAEILY